MASRGLILGATSRSAFIAIPPPVTVPRWSYCGVTYPRRFWRLPCWYRLLGADEAEEVARPRTTAAEGRPDERLEGFRE
jgi:hypothetical protein